MTKNTAYAYLSTEFSIVAPKITWAWHFRIKTVAGFHRNDIRSFWIYPAWIKRTRIESVGRNKKRLTAVRDRSRAVRLNKKTKPMLPCTCRTVTALFTRNKKLSCRRGTTRCVVSVEILPIATQQCRNYLYDKSWTKYQLSLIDPCDKIVL